MVCQLNQLVVVVRVEDVGGQIDLAAIAQVV